MGELIEPGMRCLGHTNCLCQQAHHNVAFDATANRAGQKAHQEGYAGWTWTGCVAGLRMMGTSFSRAAESEAWVLEILQHMQLQDSDA